MGQPAKQQRGISGFTLVELLVVISILAILVAIVMPVTMLARNRAREATCLSNLRQLGAALQTYSQDWDEKLPHLDGGPFIGSGAVAGGTEASSASELRAALRAHLGSVEVLRCPNDRGAPEYGYSRTNGPVSSRTGSSYLPWSTARAGRYGIRTNGVSASLVAMPSRHVLLRDYGSDWHGYRRRRGMSTASVNTVNAAFADGHAALLSVFSFSMQGREYACLVTGQESSTGLASISGGSGDVKADLTGTYVTMPSGRQLNLSGTISSGENVYSVDQVFTFAADMSFSAASRQVVYWIEGRASE